jgi:DnaA family protein
VKQLALDLAAPPAPVFDNFVTGRNAELRERLRDLAAAGTRERMLYLWGESGSGRTHLLRAAVAAQRRLGANAVYVACAAGQTIEDGLARSDCVALDDVDRLGREAQEAAFHLYNAVRERGGALLASGAAPPVQLALREDLVTRLGWGLVYRVHALTDAEKAQALADRAGALGFALPPEVRDYLLTRVRRDLPSLLAMLDGLDRHSRETKRAVTVPLVREFIEAAGPQAAEALRRGPGLD